MSKDLSPVYDLIRADGSIVLNKNLCHAIGINETIMYSELLSRYNYFNIREELDEDGFFFNTVNDFQLATCLGEKPQKAAIDNLIKLGLIDYKIKGVPPKRYFRINNNTNVLLDLLSKGKENIKTLQSKQAERIEKSKLRLLGGIESANKEELNPPNRSVNNTNSNNTNSIILNKGGSIREGTPDGDTTSIPFYDFLVQEIKNYNTEYRSEIVEAIIYYYGKYQEVFNEEHFRYSKEMLKTVFSKIDTLFSIGLYIEDVNNTFDIDMDNLKDMINEHFKTNYSGRNGHEISWTLLSFLNENVLKNKFWAVCY